MDQHPDHGHTYIEQIFLDHGMDHNRDEEVEKDDAKVLDAGGVGYKGAEWCDDCCRKT